MEKEIKIHREMYAALPDRFRVKIEHDLQYLLQAGIPGLRKVYLFGSCARGEVRSTSDIDLMVLTEDKIADRALAADIRWSLDDPINGVRTDLVFKNEQANTTDSVFDKALERDKKLILEVSK